jgi:3-deoxy-D-manno-octulosonic-acid transferase
LGYLLYSLFLKLYPLGIRIASLWNEKAGQWIHGRKNLFDRIKNEMAGGSSSPPSKVIWMHCASLGEFEQGRPVIERIRAENPGHLIILTFFSPSGFNIVKNFKGADHIFYLPPDSASNAKKFIALVDPSLVLWVKYEYWYHYLAELKRKNISTLLISGAFREGQPFFKWYGAFWRKMLQSFSWYFLQNNKSGELLNNIGINNITVSGDTRFDRVISIAENTDAIAGIKEFCNGSKVVVAGSTWEDDEAELVHYARTNRDIKFIIAPHEVDKENLRDVKKEFTGSVFYSEMNETTSQTSNTIIIDNVGMLSRLYQYADIAYVGGGFGYDGLHNILEPAVFGKPVMFGPGIERNFEAVELVECGGGIIINNALELEKAMDGLFSDKVKLEKMGAAAKAYVYGNAGASEKISEYIQEKRLLTS